MTKQDLLNLLKELQEIIFNEELAGHFPIELLEEVTHTLEVIN